MGLQLISLGTLPNDGLGETLRSGGGKINAMFTELYAAAPITYVPVLAFGGASVGITYSTQEGGYYRLGTAAGAFVLVRTRIVLTSKGSSVGTAAITLPLLTAASGVATLASFINLSTAPGPGCFTTNISSLGITLNYFSGGNVASLDNTHFGNTTIVSFSGVYQAA